MADNPVHDGSELAKASAGTFALLLVVAFGAFGAGHLAGRGSPRAGEAGNRIVSGPVTSDRVYVRDRHDRLTLSVAVLALAVACFGAGLSAWQANTADRQLAVQRDFNSRQLRAYVEVLDASSQGSPVADGPFVTRLKLKNAGLTPAYDLMAYNFLATVRTGEVNTTALVRRQSWPSITSITLGSQQEIPSPQESRAHLLQAQLDLYAQGELAFISYGRVNYKDVFGRNHYTEYCSAFVQGREAVACPQYSQAD